MSHFVTLSTTWKALTKLVSSLIFYLVDMNGYQRENIISMDKFRINRHTDYSHFHLDYSNSHLETQTTPILT